MLILEVQTIWNIAHTVCVCGKKLQSWSKYCRKPKWIRREPTKTSKRKKHEQHIALFGSGVVCNWYSYTYVGRLERVFYYMSVGRHSNTHIHAQSHTHVLIFLSITSHALTLIVGRPNTRNTNIRMCVLCISVERHCICHSQRTFH